MQSIFPLKAQQIAGQTYDCPCGRTHKAITQIIEIERGAMARTVEHCGLSGKPFVIADTNTWELGKHIFGQYDHVIFDGEDLHADEHALGYVLIEYPADTDYFIALGAGTISDIARYVSYRVQKPFVLALTAPSMDGITSSLAPLIHKQRKETYPAASPHAVFCDLDILKDAPLPMLAAGYGDMAGKYVAMLDWRVSQAVTGEHLCPHIAALTMGALAQCEAAAPMLPTRDMEAIRMLTEGLTLSGLAMQLYQDSRPASGMEHMYSHLWETQAVQRGKPVSLHGDKVGIGTLMAIDVYHEFFSKPRMPQKDMPGINYDGLLQRWDEIKQSVDELYAKKDTIAGYIKSAGGPTHPHELNIADEDTAFGFYNNFVGRARFTLSHLINEMGLLDDVMKEVVPLWIG